MVQTFLFLVDLGLKYIADERYKASNDAPEEVLKNMHSSEIHSPGFSIKGAAVPGRPAYLDFQATTPMDPRVVDAMVSNVCHHLSSTAF